MVGLHVNTDFLECSWAMCSKNFVKDYLIWCKIPLIEIYFKEIIRYLRKIYTEGCISNNCFSYYINKILTNINKSIWKHLKHQLKNDISNSHTPIILNITWLLKWDIQTDFHNLGMFSQYDNETKQRQDCMLYDCKYIKYSCIYDWKEICQNININ